MERIRVYLYIGTQSNGVDGGYSVEALGEVPYRMVDNKLMLSIPKSLLGMSGAASFFFKWADNCTPGDAEAFYTTGDAAPIGRAGYYYGP